MGKTKFQTSWQRSRPWLVADKNNVYGACCIACNTTLNVQYGVGMIESHEITNKHNRNVKVMDEGQAKFESGTQNIFMKSKANRKVVFSSNQQQWNACILRALNLIDKNYSFNSCNGDNDLYRRMFPDSAIASNYQQQRTKVSYVIEYGILPYIIGLVKEDIKTTPYTFHFDETTTSQVKKQYDGYVTYFSKKYTEVRTTYCGSLFVGKCSADDLVVHFYEFVRKAGLDTAYMIGLGMDGPNVNLLFQTKLLAQVNIITVGTCSLHTVNTGFGKAVLSLKETVTDFDQMAIDFHFFFKYSAARREQYSKCDEITGVVVKMMERHCESRWLSLQKVLVKLSEQWKNLKEYFLKKVPTLPYFTGKKGVGATARYGRLKSYLLNKDIPIVMAFLVYFAQDLKSFIKLFESSQPMIHLLFPRLMKLLRDVFGKFLKNDVFMTKANGKNVMKSVNDLINIDCKKELNHTESSSIGTRAEALSKSLDQLENKRLKAKMKEAMINSAHYLLHNLPITEQVVYDAQFLAYNKKSAKRAVKAVKRLSIEVCNALSSDALKAVFRLKNEESKDVVVDRITEEFKLYQIDDIPQSFAEALPEKSKKCRTSYWKYAYGIMDINIEEVTAEKMARIDHYWNDVASLVDEEGKPKYPNLCKLSRCISTLSHGNADPERGFSITKQQLQVHGDNIGEDMLVAIRTIKDYLIQTGGLSKFEVTVDLITRCEKSHSEYLQRQSEIKALNDAMAVEAEAQKESQQKEAEMADLERSIGVLTSGVKMAENIIKEGNAEMKKLLLQPVLHRDAMGQANEKVAVGVKRKEELSREIKELEQKKQKKQKK